MPTYRSITISLVSQFDIMSIPEYAPPTAPKDAFSTLPVLINPDYSLVSVYIPTYPSSQFWISYSISLPHPPKALYYFKLFLRGSCVVSWGCGEGDGYKGRTMFAMFGSSETCEDHPLLERRALSFGAETPSAFDADFMEIKVYRSKGRKRIRAQVQGYRETSGPGVKNKIPPGDENGIQLTHAGPVPHDHPQHYYNYVLLDPLNRPFATFRYYYRSWGISSFISSLLLHSPLIEETKLTLSTRLAEQLGALGVISTPPELTNSVAPQPSIELTTASTTDESTPGSPRHNTDPPTPPPKPPRKGTPTPHHSNPVLVSSLKSRARSLPSLSPTRSLFSSLTRRSPSPPKRTASPPPHRRGRGAGRSSPTNSSNSSSFGRNTSLGVLKGVVNNAMIRRARSAVSADDSDVPREPWTDRSADEVVERRRLSGIPGDGGPEDKDAEGSEDGQRGEDQRRGRGRKRKPTTIRDKN